MSSAVVHLAACAGPDTALWPGCFLGLRADRLIVFDSDGRSECWHDRSKRGHHPVQNTAARRPVYEPNGGPNGQPALVWDANDRGLVIPDLNITFTDLTVFAVLDQLSFKGGGASQLLLHQLNGLFLEDAGSPVVGIADPAVRQVGAAALGPQILEFRLDGTAGSVEVFRNAVSIGSDAYDGTNGLTGSTGLGAGPAAGAGNSCRMKLSELIAFDRLLSEAERGTMYRCLDRRYRLLG